MGFAETGGEIFEGLAKETAAGVSRNAVEGAGKLFMQALFEPKKARRKARQTFNDIILPSAYQEIVLQIFERPEFCNRLES